MREAGKRCRRQRIQCLLRGLPAVCPSRAYASPGFAGGPDFAACWKRKTPRHGRGGVFCRACTRLCSSLLQAPNAEASFYGKSLSFQHLQSQAPPRLRRGICVSSERASYRQVSQEAPNTPSPASPAPPPVNGGSSRCVLQLLGIEYYPASLEALLLSTAKPGLA